MSFKLYELSDSINRVSEMIEEGVEGLEDTLESLDLTFQQKVEGIIKLQRSKESESEMIENEIKRLKSRSDKLKKDAAWLGGYVEREMLNTDTREVKSSLFKIKLNLSPSRVEVINQKLIPEEFMRTTLTVVPDKMAIKESLKNGEIVPGTELKQDLKLSVK